MKHSFKKSGIKIYVNSDTPYIIGVADSWTKQKLKKISELTINGYRLFGKDELSRNKFGMWLVDYCYNNI